MQMFLAALLMPFAFTSWLAWVALVVVAVWLIGLTDTKHPVWAAVLLFVTGSLFLAANGFSWQWMTAHPWSCIGGVVGYFVIGSLWALFRFDRISALAAERFGQIRSMFIKKNLQIPSGADDVKALLETGKCLDAHYQKLWEDAYSKQFSRSVYINKGILKQNFPTDYRQFSDGLSCWLLYWPIDMVWQFISDWIVNLANTILNKLRGAFNAISLRHARSVIPNIEPPETPQKPSITYYE